MSQITFRQNVLYEKCVYSRLFKNETLVIFLIVPSKGSILFSTVQLTVDLYMYNYDLMHCLLTAKL